MGFIVNIFHIYPYYIFPLYIYIYIHTYVFIYIYVSNGIQSLIIFDVSLCFILSVDSIGIFQISNGIFDVYIYILSISIVSNYYSIFHIIMFHNWIIQCYPYIYIYFSIYIYIFMFQYIYIYIYVSIYIYIFMFQYIYICFNIYIYISSLSVSFPIGCSGPDFRRERPRTFSEAELSHPMSQTCTWRFTAATMRSVRDRSGAPGPTKATPLKGGDDVNQKRWECSGENDEEPEMLDFSKWETCIHIHYIYMEMWLEYSLEYMFLDMSRKHPSNIDPYGNPSVSRIPDTAILTWFLPWWIFHHLCLTVKFSWKLYFKIHVRLEVPEEKVLIYIYI